MQFSLYRAQRFDAQASSRTRIALPKKSAKDQRTKTHRSHCKDPTKELLCTKINSTFERTPILKEEIEAVVRIFAILFLVLSISLNPPQAGNAENIEKSGAENTVHIDRWLLLGPIESAAPAFSSEDQEKGRSSKKDLPPILDTRSLEPAEGKSHKLLFGKTYSWRTAEADTSGIAIEDSLNLPATAFLGAYIEVPRWSKVSFEIRSTANFRVYLDGAKIAEKKSPSYSGSETADAKLERGKHTMILETTRDRSDSSRSWLVDVRVRSAKPDNPAPTISLSSVRPLALRDILDIASIQRGIALSPDGSLVAFSVSSRSPGATSPEERIEIRSTRDGKSLLIVSGQKGLGNIVWAPLGKRLSYLVRTEDGTGSIKVMDLERGSLESIVDRIENLESFRWAPDGSFVIFSAVEKRETEKKAIRRLAKIEDRWGNAEDRSYLYIASFPGGFVRRITAGPHPSSIADIHPDCKRALVTRTYEDLSQRPYSTTEVYSLNLVTGDTELLWKGGWLNEVSYSPDGSKLLFRAGPTAFGEIGANVPQGSIPNDYDGQLYIFDPSSKVATPITRDFDPAVSQARWASYDRAIYIVTEDRAFSRLYRFDPEKNRFKRIDTCFEVSNNYDFASLKPIAAFVASGAVDPPKLYIVDLSSGKCRMIYDPNHGAFDNVRQGDVVPWSFVSSRGKTIDGHYYLPPDFDPKGKYPCIVYYYGGTSPTDRSYGGRYPKNLWAAHGYVVYVLQPSGATGYGQAFSASHVNDWGEIAGEEIIEGTKRFVEEHPFVDGSRLGCIGASYGGFMTQYILTKTDIFAAAVSHAGISFIGSYWGEGYWGYAYNAVAAAGSFPWNRRDIYVDRSPLFNADRIVTPLLLTHGTVDTNVPPGESEQMFTALKLLGKPVEYLRIEGQNHAVLDRDKRLVWSNSIIAWFDRYLKNEPDWWYDLYPEARPDSLYSAEKESPKSTRTRPPDIPPTIVEKSDGSRVVLGKVTREDISSAIAGWDAEYFEYKPDENILGELSGRLDGVSFVVIFGTWCSDSRQEVPRFWRIMDAIGYPIENIEHFAVESSRSLADRFLTETLLQWSRKMREYYDVRAVETIIVYRNGVEIGRIVEAPNLSIEKDLLAILEK